MAPKGAKLRIGRQAPTEIPEDAGPAYWRAPSWRRAVRPLRRRTTN